MMSFKIRPCFSGLYLVSKNLKQRDWTISLDDLFHCFTALMIKRFPLISNLDFSCFSLCPVKIRVKCMDWDKECVKIGKGLNKTTSGIYYPIRILRCITEVSKGLWYVCSCSTQLFSPPGKRNKFWVGRDTAFKRKRIIKNTFLGVGHMKTKATRQELTHRLGKYLEGRRPWFRWQREYD